MLTKTKPRKVTGGRTQREFPQLALFGAPGALQSPSNDLAETFEDLAELIERDYRVKGRRSLGALYVRFIHLRPFFRRFRPADITRELIEQYCDHRLGELRMVGPENARIQKMTSTASIDREMRCLGRMLRLAVDKGLLSRAPVFPPLLSRPSENRRRIFIDRETFAKIRDAMPADLRDSLAALYLSARSPSEIYSLQWCDVDLENATIKPRKEQNGEPRSLRLPLDPELVAVIRRAKSARRDLGCPFVFNRDGRQLAPYMFRAPWLKVTKAAGVPGAVIYDLRRSALRNLLKSGVSTRVAMALAGYKTESAFGRDMVDLGDLRAAVLKQRAFLDGQPRTGKLVYIASMTANS